MSEQDHPEDEYMYVLVCMNIYVYIYVRVHMYEYILRMYINMYLSLFHRWLGPSETEDQSIET